jgi:hypothetical protein
MNTLFIIAQSSRQAAEQTSIVPINLIVNFIWEQISTLTWLQALIAVSFGAVYLFYGWRIFKVLAVVCFGMLGLFAGIKAGKVLGSELWGGVIGLVVLAVLAVPLMRWAVSILGAAAGGIVIGSICRALGLSNELVLAGALIGIVAGGMISFIVFKISVMLFTSLGGASLVVIGILALLHLREQNQTEPTNFIRSLVNENNWFLPVVLIFTTFVGMVIQNKLVKGTSDWKL